MEYSKSNVPCRWEALLVVMDQQPFTDLREILREFDDSRIWVYADWVRTRRHQPEIRKTAQRIQAADLGRDFSRGNLQLPCTCEPASTAQ